MSKPTNSKASKAAHSPVAFVRQASERTFHDVPDTSTVQAVHALLRASTGLRSAAKQIGVSHGTLADIAKGRTGHVSRKTENRVRRALGLEDMPAIVEVSACPDCGGVHTGRCHGMTVAIRPVRPPRPVERIADMPPRALAAAIRRRVDW